MKRIKVLITDDHQDFWRIVHDFPDQLPNVSVVGEAVDGDDTLHKVENLFPDVVLMDISMPLMNGIEATRVIKQRWPGTKVLIATTHDDSLYRRQTLETGAVGCFLKGSLKPSLEAAFGIQR